MSDTDGKITWFEIAGGDGGRARGFYSGLFGWQFQPFEEGGDYQMTYEAGGAVYTSPESKGIVVYFGTSDIDSSVAKVRELGGESCRAPGHPERWPLCHLHRHGRERLRALSARLKSRTGGGGRYRQ